MNIILFTLFGFLSGIRHAFDIDHVAAVSTFAAKNKSIGEASLLGIFWGFGHTISLLLAGLIILLFKITIPEKTALSLELVVGFMLIVLGLNALFAINKNKIHIHRHKHGKEEHIHFHSHKAAKKHYHGHLPFHRSLFVGLIHGLAGSAVLSLIVLTSIKSVWISMAYILVFGIGSIIGMMLISSIISLPFLLIPKKLEGTQKILRVSAGLISAIIGFIILYRIGFTGVW